MSKQIPNKNNTKQQSIETKAKPKALQPVVPVKHAWGILLGLIAFMLYANTIGHDYTLDDSGAITVNRYVQEGLAGIAKLLKVEFWHFSNMHLGYYRPLSLITFAIEHQFFHGNPHVSHFINCFIFALSGYLLFIVLNKLFGAFNVVFPFIVVLLFITHPIHTEVVANIKSRDELLSFFNVMAMLWFALKYLDTKKILFLILSLIFCYLGMLSKETALTGVLLLPLVFFYYSNFTIIECLKKTVPFALAVTIFFIQKKYLLGTLSGTIPSDIVNYPYTKSSVKLPTTFMLFVFCLRLLLLPHPLRYDYSYNYLPAIQFNSIAAWIGVLLFTIGAYFAIKQVLSKTTWGLALGIFYITLIPALAFTVLRGGIFAERFLFSPSLGFCIAVAFGLSIILKTDINSPLSSISEWIKINIKYIAIISIVVECYSFKTITRNTSWKDNFTLFSEDIKTGENSAQNQNHYGNQYIYLASIEKDSAKKIEYTNIAVKALRQSLHIHPTFGESYYLIGLAYQIITPNTDSAIYYYNKAIETAPGYADGYYHLGIVYQNLGKNNVASYYYNEAIKYNPEYIEPKKASDALKAMGIDVYINPLKSAVDTTVANKDTKYYYDLGNYYASQGDYTHASESFEKSVQLDANNQNACINLANCYGMLKQFDKALEASNRVLAKDPKNTLALKNIAVVYNILGQTDKSNEYLQKIKEIEGK